jgi:EAL domain-containing protein (putative c-di-GMP-specific phosphodiesterase class I)/FixJ family two-component response regulator
MTSMGRKLDRALVLEDDPIARRLAVIILQGMGFTRVLEAADGHAALQVLDAGTGQNNTACDLALCDLNMAGMDGVEFLRRLGDSDRVAAVIVTSAMEPAVLRAVETMAQDSGINLLGSIPKPISRAAIETLLAQQTDTPPAASLAHNDDRRPPLMDADQLRQGLREGRLLALYQPKVALLDRQLRGAEALARWKHPEFGLLPAGHFIPLADQCGLMSTLTWQMLDQVCHELAPWLAKGRLISVSVNVSPSTLADPETADRIHETVVRHGIAPAHLVIEVTESAATSSASTLLANLARLRMRGFGLSIDDFGTGYSSMQQLSRIPFSEMKVDQMFVRGAMTREEPLAILEASLEIGRKLGLTTVAEGVETRKEWDMLAGLGCDLAQGYLIARPMTASAFDQWATSWAEQWPAT